MAISIDVRTDIKSATKRLTRIQKSVVPLATAKALTFTAEKVQKHQTQLIPKIFSNPTKTTRNAVRKTSATPKKLEASVFIKDVRGEHKWLLHHIEGGPRPQKGSERAAGRGRLAPWTAAGKDAKRNRYGNIPRATYAKMFADAQLAGLYSGDYASTTPKRRGGIKKIKYFAGVTRSGKRAIYQRVGGKKSKKIIPVLVEIKKPTYRKRWPFFKVGIKMSRRLFPGLFRKSLTRELARL